MNRVEAFECQSSKKPCYYMGRLRRLKHKPLYIKYISPTHADISFSANGLATDTIALRYLMTEQEYQSKNKKTLTMRELICVQKA